LQNSLRNFTSISVAVFKYWIFNLESSVTVLELSLTAALSVTSFLSLNSARNWIGGAIHVVEYLPSKPEAMCSNPSTKKKKKPYQKPSLSLLQYFSSNVELDKNMDLAENGAQ
jgi:hypothetical protein